MIKADTCPYCGAPYKIVFGGCRDQCATSVVIAALVAEAIEADVREHDE